MLELATCRLRPWRRGDVDALARHADNRNVSRNLRDRFPWPYSRTDARAWVRSARVDEDEVHLAIEVDGEVVGGVGLHRQAAEERGTLEIGYWLGEPFWGRGIASEVVRAMTAWAFENLDGVLRLHARVYEGNPASARVLEKAGYRLEGRHRKAVQKDGRILDLLAYGIVDDDVAEPRVG